MYHNGEKNTKIIHLGETTAIFEELKIKNNLQIIRCKRFTMHYHIYTIIVWTKFDMVTAAHNALTPSWVKWDTTWRNANFR